MKFLIVALFAILAIGSAYGGLLASPAAVIAPKAAVLSPHGVIATPGLVATTGTVAAPGVLAAPGVVPVGVPALKVGHGAINHGI
ncbi:hypothetical protein GWI33_018717 [Rhynchophorus ferrugineus]|uniref:Uncharacterized protein n=1 Tax=Rhynchophorus ferrugineus TaxID=354439 RepID=A0A834M4X7_RHYFE|nr:hypothetical protein GWI33_018717 [Rhynchophorus ferrugineus]